jgi:hypothetical protein
VTGTSAGSIPHSTVCVSSKTTEHQYNEDYLSFRFISSGEQLPHPKCVLCGDELANQVMVASELKRHFHTKHSHLCKKPTEYFKRFIDVHICQAKEQTKITTITDKAQEASYGSAKIMAKKKRYEITYNC